MNDPTATTIDINTAEKETLTQVPGVGPNIADQIIALRPFTNLEELRLVNGIGPDVYQRIEPYLTISDLNEKNAAEDNEQEKQLVVEAPALSETVAVSEEPAFAGSVETVEEEPGEPETREAEPEGAEEFPAVSAPDVYEAPSAVVYEFPEEGAEEAGAEEAQTAAAGPEASPAEETPDAAIAECVFLDTETEIEEPEKLDAAEEPLPERPAEAEPVSGVALETEPRRTEGISRSGAFWMAFFAGLISFVLAVALSLGVLASINGGLTYVGPAEFTSLRRQVDGLNTQASILVQDINGLRSRLENLEPLGGRVTGIEQANEELSANLESAVADVEQLNQQAEEIDRAVTDLVSEVETLQSRSSRFQSFLDGLRELLGGLNQP